jgi:ankyrin repeat protein
VTQALGRNFQKAALGVALFLISLTLIPVRPQAAPGQDLALIAAAERGDSAAVQTLLREGASIDARDARGRTALLAATQADRVETARLLIAAGADVNAKDAIEDSPFLYAGAEGRNEILK